MNKFLISSIVLTTLLISGKVENNSKATLPPWQPGELDFHMIYTGGGDANFMIMPDGTTMLIDAGDLGQQGYPNRFRFFPDSLNRPGDIIVNYLDRINPKKGTIDYLMVSHFHSDHIGDSLNPAPVTSGRNPDYVLSGIPRVGESIRFGNVFDRGYPDYNYPRPINDRNTNNYRNYIKWQKQNSGLKQEKFITGQKNQIKLLHNPEKYSGCFSIRNLAANGEVWLGDDSIIRCYDIHPRSLESTNENTRSLAIRVDYGPFSLYTGGDISGSLFDKDGKKFHVDSIVGIACGKVDVCKMNHHGYKDAMTPTVIDKMRSRHYLIPSWDASHTQPTVINRISSSRPDIKEPMVFSNFIPEHIIAKYDKEPWFNTISTHFGHIVVRVNKGGESYSIYVLDPSDESMRVIASYGPFRSESNHTTE